MLITITKICYTLVNQIFSYVFLLLCQLWGLSGQYSVSRIYFLSQISLLRELNTTMLLQYDSNLNAQQYNTIRLIFKITYSSIMQASRNKLCHCGDRSRDSVSHVATSASNNRPSKTTPGEIEWRHILHIRERSNKFSAFCYVHCQPDHHYIAMRILNWIIIVIEHITFLIILTYDFKDKQQQPIIKSDAQMRSWNKDVWR